MQLFVSKTLCVTFLFLIHVVHYSNRGGSPGHAHLPTRKQRLIYRIIGNWGNLSEKSVDLKYNVSPLKSVKD